MGKRGLGGTENIGGVGFEDELGLLNGGRTGGSGSGFIGSRNM